MNTTPITLNMQQLVEKIYHSAGIIAAAHSFTSIYTWQQSLDLSIYLEDNFFVVKCGFRGDNSWFFPRGNKAKAKEFISTMIKTKNFALYYMSKQDVEFLNEEFAGQFNISESPNDFEYIYSASQQRLLNTSSFSKIRKLIRHVKKNYNITHEVINQSNIHHVLKVGNAWLDGNLKNDSKADLTALETIVANYNQFNAHGVITYIDNEPCSVAIGFFLSPECFDLGFAKESYRILGLSTYTRHSLISLLPKDVQIINGEEDLGLEGLRYMKQLMRPIYLLKQYEGIALFND